MCAGRGGVRRSNPFEGEGRKSRQVDDEMRYSSIGGTSSGVVLHSAVTVLNKNIEYFKVAVREDFECCHYKEMLNA